MIDYHVALVGHQIRRNYSLFVCINKNMFLFIDLITSNQSNQSHKKILCEKSHNAASFSLSYVVFYLRKIERCIYLEAVSRTSRRDRLLNITLYNIIIFYRYPIKYI